MSVRFLICLPVFAIAASACEPMAEYDGSVIEPTNGRAAQPGQLDLRWTFTAGRQDQPAPAMPNARTLELVMAPAGQACPGPGCIIECFTPGDNAGVSGVVPPGTYDVFINLTDLARNQRCGTGNPTLLARSNKQQVVFNRNDRAGQRLDFRFPLDGGFLRVSWTITGVNGANMTNRCNAVGAGGTSVISTFANTNGAVEDIFNCNANGPNALTAVGTTGKLALGRYTVAVALVDRGRPPRAISDTATRQSNLTFGNQTDVLTPVTFEMQRNGRLAIAP